MMNNFAKSEADNETYVMPGTNKIVTAQYQEDIIERFAPSHPGTFVVGDHYVNVKDNGLVVVQPSDFYRKVNGKWTLIHEDGFSYWMQLL